MLEYSLPLTEQVSKKTRETPVTIPVLGITVGEDRWLVPMSDISEILSVPKITPVFLTHPWFLGVINVHGSIYGLCDLGYYLNDKLTCTSIKNRIFLTAPRLGASYAVLTGSVLGIRNLMEFTHQQDHQDKQSIIAGTYSDRQDRLWRMLDLRVLIRLTSSRQVNR